jgi:flagellar biosynthesis/type III secretory pathway protein FliH
MNEVTTSTSDTNARLESTVHHFSDITARVVADLGQLADQFDSHGRELAKAVDLIDGSNERATSSINERRVQLDSLVSTLDIRTEDLDQRLKRFSGLLDESLDAASARARDVARVVSESSADSSRAINEQYERAREYAEGERQRATEGMRAIYEQSVNDTQALFREANERFAELVQGMKQMTAETQRELEATRAELQRGIFELPHETAESTAQMRRGINEQYEHAREYAEDERQRAAEGMRAVYEQSVNDTQALFREANERFAQLVQGMKQMTGQMQRELEATRAELKRGIFELPHETAESTAQMRRVIVDQIEALAELNRIVARHGRTLDAVEPVRRSVREEPTLAVGGGHSDILPPRAAPPPPSPPPAPPSPPPAPPASPRSDTGGLAPATRRPETPSLAPTQSGTSRGWLSELLTRASRAEEEPREFSRESTRGPEERTPRHTIESLDSLSVDITRMIDHDTAADLWDRYKRGERNVFTRRLYTLQGQKAFDEIRGKYRADREFKMTVDRYISEFERLLEEVSHDDRGQVVARTYLTSETGKVYTMLAHAAGRFD